MTQTTTTSLNKPALHDMAGEDAQGRARDRRSRAGSQATVEQNADWFDDNDLYIATQSKLIHYHHCKRCVEHELRGIGNLLDVGNGGFFNYDTTIVDHATAVDLFLKDGPGPHPNTSFKQGSLLELPFPEQSFDGILLQNVFHHVTGKSAMENHANLRRSMKELYRCVKSGGKVVAVESTVNAAFYLFEKAVYGLALKIKKGGHPVTFQFTPKQLIGEAERAGFEVEEFVFIPSGFWLLQFGHKWPSFLTPARAAKLVLRR